MTREQLTRMLDLAEQGVSSTRIAAEIGVTRGCVTSACKRRGVQLHGKRRPRVWSPAEDRRIADLMAARRTDAEIGRDLGCSATTARDRRRALGLHRQPGTVL